MHHDKESAAQTADPAPFSRRELESALLRPDIAMEMALGGRDRMARNLSEGSGLGLLAVMLLAASLLAALPYGAVAPLNGDDAMRLRAFWRVAALYTGSLFICFPCLHVFAQFLGCRLTLIQNLVVALLIPAVAGFFSFGFFPIIWFIELTTEATPGRTVSPAHLSTFLLGVGMVMGMAQMARCLLARDGIWRVAVGFPFLIGFWLLLLVFITQRMARLLGLL